MKHLFLTQDFGPDLGGMARRHVEICRRFAPDEVLVDTVAASDGGAFDAHEHYTIHRQPFRFREARHFGNQVRWARAVARECAAGVEVIHCANIRPGGYVVTMARLAHPTPYVLYVNGGDLLRERDVKAKNPAKRLVARRIFSGACAVIGTSDWVVSLTHEVMDLLGVEHPPPVTATSLGADPRQFAPSRDRGWLRARFALGAAPVLLTVARLVPHKGQDVGLRVLASLHAQFPTLRHVIVGEGPDAPRLEQLARALGVADRVIFAGALSDEDLADAYATSTVYLGLSRVDRGINAEGFGLAFVEAGASGVPSVAGDSGGVRSAVRDGETGLVVPPTDIDAASAALRALLVDDALRRRMGNAARRAVETHYNWDRVARDTIAFAREAALATPSRGKL